jgi:hypothetical protein
MFAFSLRYSRCQAYASVWAIILFPLFFASPCIGAMDSAVVASARELGEQGLKDYDEGRYEQSADELIRAYRIMQVPTPALYAARALVKCGKLVQATELLLEASRLVPNEYWRGNSQQDAQESARNERQLLLARIAHLRIIVLGASTEGVHVTVDSIEIPSELIGVSQLADPGQRTIVAQRGDSIVEMNVHLEEGETREVSIDLGVLKSKLEALKNENVSLKRPLNVPAASEKSGNTQRILGWTAIGVGTAGMVTWGVFGGLALLKRSNLPASCRNSLNCPEHPSDVDTYNRDLTISTTGFVVGTVGAVAGVSLLLTLPHTKNGTTSLTVTPSTAVLTGAF